MHDRQKLPHIRWDYKYYVVIVHKYRKKVLYGNSSTKLAMFLGIYEISQTEISMIYHQVSSISSNDDITRPVCSGFYLILGYGLVVIGWSHLRFNPAVLGAETPTHCQLIW